MYICLFAILIRELNLMKMSKNTNEKLMEEFSFNEKDLSLNRQLKLSEKQKHKLKPEIEIYIGLSFLFTTISFCAAVFALFTGYESAKQFFLTSTIVLGFGASFFWAFISVQWLNQIKKYSGVYLIEGKADFDISYKSNGSNQNSAFDIAVYSMKVGNIKFYLDEETYDSIVGDEFRVYYFQTLRKVVLSIENI